MQAGSKEGEAIPAIGLQVKIPASLRDLARVIGDHNVKNLIDQFGGLRIDVPKSTASQAKFMNALDQEGKEKITKNFSGERIYLPRYNSAMMEDRNATIIKWYKDGKSVNYISRNFSYQSKMSERAIYNILINNNV